MFKPTTKTRKSHLIFCTTTQKFIKFLAARWGEEIYETNNPKQASRWTFSQADHESLMKSIAQLEKEYPNNQFEIRTLVVTTSVEVE